MEELKTNMKTSLCILLLFVALLGNAQTYTLKDCIEAATKNNIDVKEASLRAETAGAYAKQSKAIQLPFLSSGISHGINQGRSIDPFTNSYVDQSINYANYSINTNVVLWNGGNLRNSSSRDAFNYEAGKLELQQAKENITINVILAYLQVLNNEEQLELAKQQVEITRQQVERLNVLNKQGAIVPATFYDLKGQLATDELNEINVQNNVQASKLTLARLMNVDYSPAIQLQKLRDDAMLIEYADKPDSIYQNAVLNLSLVKAAEYRLKSASKEIAAAKGSRSPSLVFSGNMGTNYSSAASTLALANTADVLTNDYVIIGGNKSYLYSPQNTYSSQKISYINQWKNNLNSSISIGLRIPVLNGAQAKTRINLAKITEQRTTAELQNTKSQLKNDIQLAHLNMASAYERYIKLQQQVEDFTTSFKSAELRFVAGVGTSVDYLISKSNLDKAKANLIAAKYDCALRSKILDFYQGRQTAW
jgi:outer membrane protein